MAKAPTTEQPQAETPISLDEFCRRLSRTNRRVSLISGFHFSEQQAGNTRDLESEFAARFKKFTFKPV